MKDDLETLFIWMVVFFCALLLLLLVIVAVTPRLGHAASCLSIDVPPQAVLSVHDGDTFNVFSMQPGGVVRVRVQGVNTPELSKRKGDPDEPGAVEAREFTRSWLAKGTFTMSGCGKATLDRTVWIVVRNGRTLAQDLIDAGWVVPTP